MGQKVNLLERMLVSSRVNTASDKFTMLPLSAVFSQCPREHVATCGRQPIVSRAAELFEASGGSASATRVGPGGGEWAWIVALAAIELVLIMNVGWGHASDILSRSSFLFFVIHSSLRLLKMHGPGRGDPTSCWPLNKTIWFRFHVVH